MKKRWKMRRNRLIALGMMQILLMISLVSCGPEDKVKTIRKAKEHVASLEIATNKAIRGIGEMRTAGEIDDAFVKTVAGPTLKTITEITDTSYQIIKSYEDGSNP